MRELEQPTRGQLCLTEILHALSDPTRLAVVAQLDAAGELSCGCLAVRVAKSTLSQHLRVLRHAGITNTRCVGNLRMLSVRRAELDALFPGLLDAVLAARGDWGSPGTSSPDYSQQPTR